MIEKFAKDFEGIAYGQWDRSFTFEQEQGDDLIQVTANIDKFCNLCDFEIVIIDIDGNRRDSDFPSYSQLFDMADLKARELYEVAREEARYE